MSALSDREKISTIIKEGIEITDEGQKWLELFALLKRTLLFRKDEPAATNENGNRFIRLYLHKPQGIYAAYKCEEIYYDSCQESVIISVDEKQSQSLVMEKESGFMYFAHVTAISATEIIIS